MWPSEEKTGGKLSYGEEVDDLIANDKVEVSLENKIVWVTIVDGNIALADGSAKTSARVVAPQARLASTVSIRTALW